MSQPPKKITIKDWDVSDRPREKLHQHGASYLSNAELIAILIGSGSPKEIAVDLMKRVLQSVDNNLLKLHKMPLEHLVKFNGIGMASKLVYEQIRHELALLDHEEFWVLYLNQSSKLLEKFRLSQGGITQTVVDIRLALKRAFEVGATALILVHNHPSGSLKPSGHDKELTQKFRSLLMKIMSARKMKKKKKNS